VRDLEADRVIGIVGALTVVVATGLSWYSARMPDLGSAALVGSLLGVSVGTALDVGPFVALLGGLLLLVGGAAAARAA